MKRGPGIGLARLFAELNAALSRRRPLMYHPALATLDIASDSKSYLLGRPHQPFDFLTESAFRPVLLAILEGCPADVIVWLSWT